VIYRRTVIGCPLGVSKVSTLWISNHEFDPESGRSKADNGTLEEGMRGHPSHGTG